MSWFHLVLYFPLCFVFWICALPALLSLVVAIPKPAEEAYRVGRYEAHGGHDVADVGDGDGVFLLHAVEAL